MERRQRLADFLRKCSRNLLLDQGLQVHGLVVRFGFGFDLMLNNDLIDMYGKCGEVNIACKVFDKMTERNVVSWTALMCGYLQNGNAKKSLSLFQEMGFSGIKPNDFTFSTNLKACGLLGIAVNGIQIHGLCEKTGFACVTVVGNSIVDMYAKCGRISEAVEVFVKMPDRDLISWNVLIAGYTLVGTGEKALLTFRKMQGEGKVPDEYTFTTALKACSGLGGIREGTQIHGSLIMRGFPYQVRAMIAGALIDLYAKCGFLFEAHKVFDLIEQKNVISWSALILGYAQEGKLEEAMELFRKLRESGIPVDGFVLSSITGFFANLAFVEQGKQMHGYAVKLPSGLDISVSNSIVDMYLKCGLPDEAGRLFTEMPVKNVVSWTVMITGYGKHGLGKEAIRLFNEMQSDSVEPDGVAYLAILSACSHSGLVEESQKYFSRLCNDERIKPRIEHYACMVDLLGRAGCLKEAKNLIETMPLNPNVEIWQTLLSACRVHRDIEMGREVGQILLGMDGDNPANYVMMSNIYSEAGHWSESEKVRNLVKKKQLKKEAGCSWVEIDKKVNFFYGGDDTHPLIEKIHGKLKELETRMKEEMGYKYELRYALHDVEEESREESLRVHSEKLAIGLALVCGGLEMEGIIRVFKNMRVCGDCHEFIKGLSKVTNKVFLVRDANRFHKFENGLCSCGDYW